MVRLMMSLNIANKNNHLLSKSLQYLLGGFQTIDIAGGMESAIEHLDCSLPRQLLFFVSAHLAQSWSFQHLQGWFTQQFYSRRTSHYAPRDGFPYGVGGVVSASWLWAWHHHHELNQVSNHLFTCFAIGTIPEADNEIAVQGRRSPCQIVHYGTSIEAA